MDHGAPQFDSDRDRLVAVPIRPLASTRSDGVPMPTASIPSLILQAEMSVGPADDRYEREADDVAERVTRILRAPVVDHPDATVDPSGGERGHRVRRSSVTADEPQRTRPIEVSAMARRTVQRKGHHFLEYLSSATPLAMNTPKDREDIILSWALDQNIYELVNLISDDAAPLLENLSALTHQQLTVQDVAAYFRQKLGTSDVTPADLSPFIQNAPAHITKRASDSNVANQKAPMSQITWSGLTGWGAGTGVEILMLPGGIPGGSQPSSEPVWIKTVERHVAKGSRSTMYVRGHLLNHNIGGPGLDYNMVPITGKTAKNVGGNDSNGEHLDVVERLAKSTWDQVRLGKLASARYRVVPHYHRQARPQTAFVRAQAMALQAIVDKLGQEQVAQIQNMAPQDRQQLLTDARQYATGMQVSDDDLVKMIAISRMRPTLGQPYGALLANKHPVAVEIQQTISDEVLESSTQGRALMTPLEELIGLVRGNALTWEAEDRYIPTSLGVALWATDLQGTETELVTLTNVPITLSTDVRNVYYRPFKTNEI